MVSNGAIAMGEGRNSSATLRRGVRLLETVAASSGGGRGITATELSTHLSVHVSTVLRLAAPLVEAELLRRDEHGHFYLGKGTLRLASSYLADLDLRSVATGVLAGREWPVRGATASVSLRDGTNLVILAEVREPGKANVEVIASDERRPLYCTAAGKALLSAGDPTWIDHVIKTGLAAITARTITDPTELRSELTRSRVRGYAIEDREFDSALRAVGTPLFGASGRVVGAIQVTTRAEILTPTLLRPTAQAAVDAAREISAAMGDLVPTRSRERPDPWLPIRRST